MKMTAMKDPFAERLYNEYIDLYDSWIGVDITKHIWITELPVDLKPGVHKIVVIAKDEYGNKFRQTALFELY